MDLAAGLLLLGLLVVAKRGASSGGDSSGEAPAPGEEELAAFGEAPPPPIGDVDWFYLGPGRTDPGHPIDTIAEGRQELDGHVFKHATVRYLRVYDIARARYINTTTAARLDGGRLFDAAPTTVTVVVESEATRAAARALRGSTVRFLDPPPALMEATHAYWDRQSRKHPGHKLGPARWRLPVMTVPLGTDGARVALFVPTFAARGSSYAIPPFTVADVDNDPNRDPGGIWQAWYPLTALTKAGRNGAMALGPVVPWSDMFGPPLLADGTPATGWRYTVARGVEYGRSTRTDATMLAEGDPDLRPGTLLSETLAAAGIGAGSFGFAGGAGVEQSR